MRKFGTVFATIGFLAVASLLLAQVTPVQRTTKLTISVPTEISGTILEPGTYTLKVLDYTSGKQVVQVTNANDQNVLTTVMAQRLRRNLDTDQERGEQTEFTYTIANGHPSLSTWYHPGDEWGERFATGLVTWSEKEAVTIRYTPIETVAEKAPAPEPVENAPPETIPLPTQLPTTGSNVPLLGLTGLLALAAAAGVHRRRN
jgi:LPXTG-motif cell wall-anchored protein